MTYAATPRQIRKKLNLTQREMAQGVGVNVSTVWRWEASGIPVRGSARMLLDKLAREAGFSGLKDSTQRGAA